MTELPSGTVTFLFTDLEGSTRLWEEHPDAMRRALARHDEILRDGIADHRGHVVKTTGDGFHAVFATAHDALDAAVATQLELSAESFAETGRLRVRMGLHTCEAECRGGDYYGSEVNRAARLMSVAHGDQIVVSSITGALVHDAPVHLVDLGEHRLRDLTILERIYQVSAPGLARDFPALRSLDSLPGNLPRQVTTFVGREAEIASVAELVRSTSVVTLTGVGGVGKTRLALQVAAEVVPHFRDGAWFAELAGVRDPDAVADALFAMFGLQPRGGMSATSALLDFLVAKNLLLVLDNCEHLLRPVATLVDQVARKCPGVRMLATSREGLNVAAERMLGVASLDVPGEGAEPAVIAQCAAVVLFVERAGAVKASFALDEANADAVAQVCRRLDGIALAIELAAARVATLTPAELARRLDSRFRLLASGQRTTVERHQTLRAAIDWSYDLLDATEQSLLSRLSVFAGGFDLEAAEAVTAGGVVEIDDVFELLATLVARSLVVADTEGIDTRYRLLETIRQYAQEHLDESGDGERVRTAHAVYYAGFSELAVANVVSTDGVEWQRRLGREYDNLRAALTWATDARDLDVALRLLGIWETPNLLTEASLFSTSRWSCDTLLALPGAAEHPGYPGALAMAAFFAFGQGDQELARRRCEEAGEAERRLGSEPSLLLPMARANVALAQGNAVEAGECARQAVSLARAKGEPVRLANALGFSAMAHTVAGEPAVAIPDAEAVVALAEQLANRHVVREALAMAALALGDAEPDRAVALALEVVERIAPGEYSMAWAIAGDLAARTGKPLDALNYFGEHIDVAHWLGDRTTLGVVVVRVADLLADRDVEAAAVLQSAGESFVPGFHHAPHVVDAHERAIAIVNGSLAVDRVESLRARGMAMSDAEVVTYAQAAIARCVAESVGERE